MLSILILCVNIISWVVLANKKANYRVFYKKGYRLYIGVVVIAMLLTIFAGLFRILHWKMASEMELLSPLFTVLATGLASHVLKTSEKLSDENVEKRIEEIGKPQ